MQPRNRHGQALDRMGLDIVSGGYAVGASLPAEPLLCDALGVSRTVVREAVKSLVAKGLLVTGPKLGTRVLPETSWNWFDADVVRWTVRSGLTRAFLRDLQPGSRARRGRCAPRCGAGARTRSPAPRSSRAPRRGGSTRA